MLREDTINLIKQTFEANSIGDLVATETRRTVFCVVESITARRGTDALSNGNHPEIKFTLSNVLEYEDERILEYNGKRYNIITSSIKDGDRVELTARVY